MRREQEEHRLPLINKYIKNRINEMLNRISTELEQLRDSFTARGNEYIASGVDGALAVIEVYQDQYKAEEEANDAEPRTEHKSNS